jgi:hypothetical protein
MTKLPELSKTLYTVHYREKHFIESLDNLKFYRIGNKENNNKNKRKTSQNGLRQGIARMVGCCTPSNISIRNLTK